MKLTISKQVLSSKLNISAKAISTKNIIPVLSGIKFDLKKEGLFITTSNDDIAIETFIDKKDIKKIEEEGSIIVPGRYFLDIIRKIDDNNVSVETDGLKIIITTKRGEYTLNGMNANEFPNIRFNKQENPIKLSNQVVRNIINQTVFAVSNQESRPVLTGVNFSIKDDVLECVATDSYRLAKKIVILDSVQSNTTNIVIPGKNLLELSKLIEEDDKDIELHIFSNNILFKTDDMLFQSRLLNDTYPEVSKLIPTQYKITITANLTELYDAIDRVSLLTDEKNKNLIKMELKGKSLTLTSISQELGKMEETIDVEKDCDEDIVISYSSKYMMDALRTLKCENVNIRLNSEIKPIIIKNSEDNNLIQLVLPIKTF